MLRKNYNCITSSSSLVRSCFVSTSSSSSIFFPSTTNTIRSYTPQQQQVIDKSPAGTAAAAHFVPLYSAATLAADLPPRFMTWADFETLCAKHDIPQSEARAAAARLAKCGAVVVSEDGVHGHAPQAIRDACAALNEPWNPVSELESTAEVLRKELATLRPAYETQLRKAVSGRRSTWAGAFAYSGVQLAVFSRLTYFDLDWDTMEPVSFFLGSGIGVLAFFFMLFRGFDFSNRDVDREVIRKKYIHHPDVIKYFETHEKIEKLEKEIEAVMVWVRTGKTM